MKIQTRSRSRDALPDKFQLLQ